MIGLKVRDGHIIPKYYQLKTQIIRRIEHGSLKAGDPIPSEPQIVEDLGVSRCTIRQALSELAQEGYLLRKQGKGTFVAPRDGAADGARKGVAGTGVGIAFLTTEQMKHPYTSKVLQAIGAGATEYRYHTQFFVSKDDNYQGVRTLLREAILTRRIGGLLLVEEGEKENVEFLLETGIPFVNINLEFTIGREIPTVRIDGRQAIRIGLEHLLGLGHRRIALVAGPGPSPRSCQRTGLFDAITAYRDCLKKAGVRFDPALVRKSDYTVREGRDITRELLELPDPPTAFYLGDDILAFGARTAITEKGLRVPGDVSLVALGDLLGLPDMTVVRIPFDELAKKAMTRLSRLISGAAAKDTGCVQGQ